MLGIYIHQFNLVGGRGKSYVFAQIRWRSCAGLLLESLEVRAKLDVVDANLAGWREFNEARASVRPKRVEGVGVKRGGSAEKPQLILGTRDR